MKQKRSYLLFFMMMLLAMNAMTQNEPEKAGSVSNGKLLIRIDLSWKEDLKTRLSELFMLDSLLMQAIFEQNTNFINDSTDWEAVIRGTGILELSRTLENIPEQQFDNIILSEFYGKGMAPPGPVMAVVYGTNELKDERAFTCQDGTACFFLPSFNKAKKVYLSGTFNNWSTMQLPMQQTDSGWVACLPLSAGKYLYKYIVDGRWMQDPNNSLRERDGHRGYNSIIYCHNYLFSLQGHKNARRVFLAGSFNDWRPRQLQMKQTDNGWHLPMYIREGTHTYKFVVDGQWITDPANPQIRDDGAGNLNSFISIGDTLIFSLNGYTQAERVILSGTFNAWNTGELSMEKHDSGWRMPYVLAAGNYEYKFIVDGQWITDPENPFTSGQGDFSNSFVAFKPNHVFELSAYPNAESVIVTGSFNGWNHNEYRMVLKEGKWVFPIYLTPGRHNYKFIVNGEWVLDPENPLWEENEFGTGNSVLWIAF